MEIGRKSSVYWTYSTIHKILQNEMYIGNMVQGKKYQEIYGRQKIKKKEEWVVVEGTQEAIIDKETWDRTQRLLNKKTHITGTRAEKNVFAGINKMSGLRAYADKKRRRRKNALLLRYIYSYGEKILYAAYGTVHRIERDPFS